MNITLKELGPLRECKYPVEDVNIIIGRQSSGKSTIAKSVFFFKNINNIIKQAISKQFAENGKNIDDAYAAIRREIIKELFSYFPKELISKDTYLSCEYSDGMNVTFHQFTLVPLNCMLDLPIALEKKITGFLINNTGYSNKDFISVQLFKDALDNMIDSVELETEYELTYIPSSRAVVQYAWPTSDLSMGTGRGILYSDDPVMNLFCHEIIQCRGAFKNGVKDYLDSQPFLNDEDNEIIFDLLSKVGSIIGGEYLYEYGDKIKLDNEILISNRLMSSGQQELIWVLNPLIRSMFSKKSIFFVIEEPETGLYPNTQRELIDFIIWFVKKLGHKVLITTHSPFILTELSNFSYAGNIEHTVDHKKLEQILAKEYWLDVKKMTAKFVENGTISDAFNERGDDINTFMMDETFDRINNMFDRMLELKASSVGDMHDF